MVFNGGVRALEWCEGTDEVIEELKLRPKKMDPAALAVMDAQVNLHHLGLYKPKQ